jgi:hypothetical protein
VKIVNNEVAAARTAVGRTMIESLAEQFAQLHSRSCKLIETTPAELLYRDLMGRNNNTSSQSMGEFVLRSAAAVEQTFGGITANLWDDPFEWTLPEVLSTPERIIEYLAEVEQTRQHAFGSFIGDKDLLKEIACPSGERRLLIDLLLDTIVRAASYQGRAIGIRASLFNSPPAEYH